MKFASFISALLLPLAAFADGGNAVIEKVSKMPPSRILYTETVYDAAGTAISSVSGTLDLQYPEFSVSYGKFLICGNASTMWMCDTKADEITISGGSALEAILSDSSATLDDKVSRLTVRTSDGHVRVFDLILVEEMTQRWPASHFVIEDSAIGENTIVTDLR